MSANEYLIDASTRHQIMYQLSMVRGALIKVSHQMDSQLADEDEKLFIINPVREDKG